MFQFTGLPSHELWIHSWIHTHYHMWVPPFGNLRVKGYVRLTAAYRSLSRPSSAPIAKASALCSYSLNLISWSFLRFTIFKFSSSTSVEDLILSFSFEIVVNYPLKLFNLANLLFFLDNLSLR